MERKVDKGWNGKKGDINVTERKRILLYANYFFPDKSAMSRLMTDLASGLSDDFDVTVICSVPSYAGTIEAEYKEHRFYYDNDSNMNIIRVRVSENDKSSKIKRIRHILDYFFNAILATIKIGKCDLVYATTAPPILGGLLGLFGKIITRSKFVYVIQDFNPEQIKAVSYSKNKFVLLVMQFLDNMSCKFADRVVVIGRDMQETLDRRFNAKKLQAEYIHNWVDEDEMYPLDSTDPGVCAFKEKYNVSDKYLFMYLGNLGLYYDLPNILKIFAEFKDKKDVAFMFVGTGAVEKELKSFCAKNTCENVIFVPYQSGKDLLYAMNAADVHIVTNSKGIKGVSVPSKIYGIMAVNKPVLGILEKDSEVWRIIDESKIGCVVETGDYGMLRNVLNDMILNKQSIKELGKRSRNALLEKYSKQDSLNKYKELFISLLGVNSHE